MRNLKLLLFLSLIFVASCTKKDDVYSESFLQIDENQLVEELQSLNAEIFKYAFSQKDNASEFSAPEDEDMVQKIQRLESLIVQINGQFPEINVSDLLVQSSISELNNIYNEGDYTESDDNAEYVPCTEAFALSATMAAVAYTVSVIASGGTATGVATIVYAASLAVASYNWCQCMENNYDDFEGC